MDPIRPVSAGEGVRVERPLTLPVHDVASLRAYLARAAELLDAGEFERRRDVLVEMSGYLGAALDRAQPQP